jgi:AraC-like DNA-binding protein
MMNKPAFKDPSQPPDTTPGADDAGLEFMTRLEGGAGLWQRPSRAVISYLPKGFTRLPTSTFSLKYLEDGEEVYRTASTSHLVRGGQLLIAPAGEAFEVELRRPSAGLCLYFDVPWTTQADVSPLRLEASEFELGRTVAEAAGLAMRSPSEMERQAKEILAQIRRRIDPTLEQLEAARTRVGGVRRETRRQRLERLMTGRLYLEHNAHRPVPLDEAARAAGMSVFHFARQFATAFGESPAAFHDRLRLTLARDLLIGGLSATQVAGNLGYSELSAFSRAFTRRFGVSPRKFLADLSLT